MKEIKIDPRIVKHLGRDLITTSEVAVIELVKNSLDARAPEINIRLYSGTVPMDDTTRSVFDEIVPRKFHNSSVLIVEDTGNGMTDTALDDGFLTVGTDLKASDDGKIHYTPTKNIELKLTCTANQYTVGLNKGNCTNLPQTTISATYDKVLPAISSGNLPSRTGYSFKGFYSSDGKTTYYNNLGQSSVTWKTPSKTLFKCSKVRPSKKEN